MYFRHGVNICGDKSSRMVILRSRNKSLFSKGTECHNFINKMFFTSYLTFELIRANIKYELLDSGTKTISIS